MINDNDFENMVLADAAEKIASVLDGTKNDVSIYVRPNHVLEILKERHGFDDDGSRDFETNGWSWDFWMNIDIKDKSYMLSGDGYYGLSINFSVAEEY